MRVLIIGNRLPDYFADNVATSLEDAGHEVRAVAPFEGWLAGTKGMAPRMRNTIHQFPDIAPRLQRHVVEAAEEYRPDIVLNLDYRLLPDLVPQLRAATGSPVVFWFPDAPGNVRQETFVLAGYDALFLKDSQQAKRYRDTLRLNAHYLPQGCNPRWHKPVGDLAPPTGRPSILVAGNVYATRFLVLQRLLAEGFDLRIYGSAWPRWLPADDALRRCYQGRAVFREEKARAFRGASIVLNNLASHEGDGLNARLFEAAACGAVVLCEHRARLPELFERDEVTPYVTVDELVDEARRLGGLAQPERESIAAAASARAHAEHTNAQRFGVMVEALASG